MRSISIIALPLAILAIAPAACKSPPERIEPTGPKAIVTENLDYSDLREWADSLTQEMLVDGFLEQYPKPVIMQVSTIENKTSIPDVPTEMVIGRIRSALRQDNRVRFVATLGSDGRDQAVRDNTALVNDPMFDQKQVAERTAQGTASVPMLSVNTQVLSAYERNPVARQRNYEMRMWVVDLRTGETVWEGFSNPVSKKSRV
jgi:PBP1b-binding outer membrane lipoprotein LpoB